jgi:hypothetical protein
MSDHSEIMQERIRERAWYLWQASGCTDEGDEHFWRLAEQQVDQEEKDYDKTLKDSFPASDPPANSGFTS